MSYAVNSAQSCTKLIKISFKWKILTNLLGENVLKATRPRRRATRNISDKARELNRGAKVVVTFMWVCCCYMTKCDLSCLSNVRKLTNVVQIWRWRLVRGAGVNLLSIWCLARIFSSIINYKNMIRVCFTLIINKLYLRHTSKNF